MMAKLEIKHIARLAFVAGLAVSAAGAEGCGSNKQTAPPGAAGAANTGGAAGTGTSSAGNSSAGKTSAEGGDDTAASAGAAGEAGAATGGGGTGGIVDNSSDCGPGCTSPLGCCTCPPTTNFQILNACIGDGTCGLSYDNSLVPKLVANGGKLPPLP
jgi:hypothetical protein